MVFFLNSYPFCLSYSRASDYGLMKIDDKGRIVQFSEKPKGSNLKAMVDVKNFSIFYGSNPLIVSY